MVITFEEDIQGTAGSYGITVTDSSNASATSGPAVTDASDATKLSVPLKSGLANGRYVVRWNNTSSDDGDALNGAFSFYIGTQPTSADLAADQELEAVEANELATASAEATEAERHADDRIGSGGIARGGTDESPLRHERRRTANNG